MERLWRPYGDCAGVLAGLAESPDVPVVDVWSGLAVLLLRLQQRNGFHRRRQLLREEKHAKGAADASGGGMGGEEIAEVSDGLLLPAQKTQHIRLG